MADLDGSPVERGRPEFEQGLPGYHDPTAALGPQAVSALTLRLVLAVFGFVVCVAAAVVFAVLGAPIVLVVLFAVVAATAVIDIGVVARRKGRGEPG